MSPVTPAPGASPEGATVSPARQRNRFSRAVRAAVAELFGFSEPAPAAPPAGRTRTIARAAYAAAETTRFNIGWRTSNEAADDDIRGSIMTARGRARDLARNNPYIERFKQLLVLNVIGPEGPTHQAQVRFPAAGGRPGVLDETTNDVIEAGWKEYCRGPVTVDGRLSMLGFQCQQLETWGIDGEAFTRTFIGRQWHHGLALQSIDPDLVAESLDESPRRDGTEIRMGVEMDEYGRRLRYWLWDWPRYMPGSKNRPVRPLPASEVLHHFRASRGHQTRGITPIARVIPDIQDLAGYDEAVILGARAGANQLMILQWKDPSLAPVPDVKENPEEARRAVSLDLNPATATEIDPGLEAVPFDPKQPSGVYADFTKTVIRRIASGLNLTYSSLSNDLREVNYSSTKVGLQLEREMWKMLQEWWIETFVQPVYERWLEAAVLSGALQLPNPDWRAYAAVSWTPRRWPWIEPQREIGATREMIELGLTSRQRVLAEQSDGDFRKVVEELEQESELAAEAGVSVMPAATAPASDPDDDERPDSEDEPAGGDAEGDEPARPRSRATRASAANRVAALTRNGHAS